MTAPVERLTSALSDRYRVERELGQGGMATVYLAEDVRHHRKVAIKVLHPELSAILGGERFLKEIELTANLQHPHILPLFDSGNADGLLFYVMPYVEGEALRQRLEREQQLPIGDALRIASDIADALEYAHKRGVVHRDVKPENILLHDGRPMVADFGIALAVQQAGGARMTQTGISLGTPQYMAPEQAMGDKSVDHRADIYALGAVTYEMLTGEPPFTGPNAQAIVAKILTTDASSLSGKRRSVPPAVNDAVLTALEKLPADRFGSAREFGQALRGEAAPESQRTAAGTRSGAAARAPAGVRERLRDPVTLGLAAAVILLVAALGLGGSRQVAAPSPVVQFNLLFGSGVELVDVPGAPFAFAPDGSRLAFVGRDASGARMLYVRALGQLEPAVAPGTRNALVPFFSPDGQSLGFWQDSRLRRVPPGGGPIATIAEVNYPEGAVWGPNDMIVLAQGGRLLQVSASGGNPEVIIAPDSATGERYRWPDLTSDGKVVLFTVVDSSGTPSLAAAALRDRKVVPLGQAGMAPRYIDGGRIMWTSVEGVLYTADFDARRLRLAGAPQAIVEDVRTGPARIAKLTTSRNGSIAYLSGSAISRELVVADSTGSTETLPLPPDNYAHPRLSPDGRRIAVTIAHDAGARNDVWIYDRTTRALTRLTSDSVSRDPEWLPDGRSVLFLNEADRIPALFRVAADGSGQPEQVLSRPNGVREVQIGRDGRTVVFRENHPQTRADLWYGLSDSLAAAKPLLATRFSEHSPALSPSGLLLAYVSNETGDSEVYVRHLRAGSARLRVSPRGGIRPRWAPSGRELFFVDDDSVYAVRIDSDTDPQPGPPRAVGVLLFTPNLSDFDVMPDGKRFLYARYDLQNRAPGIRVLLHWFGQSGAR